MNIENRACLMMATLDIAALYQRDVLNSRQLIDIFGDSQGKEYYQHYINNCKGNLLAFFSWMHTADRLRLVMNILEEYRK